jgi:hypothetical protein
MRSVVAALMMSFALGGCISSIDNAYDEHARSECERETSPRDRGECLDRVDRNRQRR